MKKVYQILKSTSIKMCVIGLAITFLINSCSKEIQNSEPVWKPAEYKAVFDQKEYLLKVKYQENGEGIKLDPSTPPEIIEFFKKSDTNLAVHVIDEKVYYYSSIKELEKNIKFEDSKIKNQLKSYNGAIGQFFEHANNGGWIQTDELKTWGWMLAPYNGPIPTNIFGVSPPYPTTPVTNPYLLTSGSQTVLYITQMNILGWHGATSWVGSNYNDKISTVGAVHYDKSEPVHMVCFENISFSGKRLLVTKSSLSNQSYTFLGSIVMSYGVFWSTSWNDKISSHYTTQCPAWVMGNGLWQII